MQKLKKRLDKGVFDLLTLQIGMKENKEVRISYWAAHLTTIVSVTLVLILIGMIALIWIGADKETRRLKENIELSVVMTDSVSDAQGQSMAQELKKQPYVAQVKFVSKREALDNWTRDTGENLEEMFGVNPMTPEVNFTVKSEFATPKQLDKIVQTLRTRPGVEEVSMPDASMIDSMNSNLQRLTLILTAVAVIMLVISFVLINNTVHLTIYSRRFTIHTMQLVGATNGFIERPIVLHNLLAGTISGILASLIIMAIFFAGSEGGVGNGITYIGWPLFGCVCGVLVILGLTLCSLAAWIASSKYLHKDYDQLSRI